MSTPTVLPAAALALATPPVRAAAPVRSGLARAALLVTPVPLAVAAAGSLSGVPLPAVAGAPWPVPVAALAAGWTAAGGLARSGSARTVGTGFLWLAGVWSVLLAVVPVGPALPDRLPWYLVSLPVLGLLAAVAAALATGTEARLLRWSTPALLAAGALLAGLPPPGAGLALLGAGVGMMVVGGFLPARVGGGAMARGAAGAGGVACGAAGAGGVGAGGGVVLGCVAATALAAGQVAVVVMLWQATAGRGPVPPGLAPLLVTVPLTEAWVGWHLGRLAAVLARDHDRAAHQRAVRRLAWATLAALLPLLVAAAALVGTAHRLPYGLSAHPDPPDLVLALAAGVLAAAVLAAGRLLAARDRAGAGVLVTVIAAAPAGVALATGQSLSVIVALLAIACLAGLVVAGYILFDSRSLR